MKLELRGLYAITSQAICDSPARLEAGVAAAIAGGARLIQYRDKRSDAATRIANARQLRQRCRDAGVVFIVNDDMQLAAEVEADGVHLGKSDGSIAAARALLGDGVLIGVSCSGDLARALTAQQQGADYVAFGRFYDSNTKPDAPLAALMKRGVPPTERNARTGELTPPGMRAWARWNSSSDRLMDLTA